MDPAAVFDQHRPRLFGIAYRMLGSRADAEDVVQDAWLRWHQADTAELRSAEAWLVTVVTRLSVDRLRGARREREAYKGVWLPEPLVTDAAPSAEATVELAGDLSVAFLAVLERLGPEERAAFLLHEVFELEHSEIAAMLGKSPEACRQMVHRARKRVRDARPRFQVSREAHRRLLERFAQALGAGDRESLMTLFADDVTLEGDGGGKVPAVTRTLQGAERVARLYHVFARRNAGRYTFRLADINGEPGLLRFIDGRLESASAILTDGVHILAIHTVRNPDKLRHIPAA